MRFSGLFGPKGQQPQLKGFSLWGVGISWEYTQSDFNIINGLIRFLEDRRELFDDCGVTDAEKVLKSIQEIRAQLGHALTQLSADSKAIPILQAMQRRCRDFVNEVEPQIAAINLASPSQRTILVLRLGGLREVFWIYVAILSRAFGITVRNELRECLPNLD